MNEVVLKRCGTYNVEIIEKIVREVLAELGVELKDAVSHKKVLLKPNLLGAHLPEKGVTTHPVFVEAVIRVCKDYSCELWLGDSPNGVQKSLDDVWAKTGMAELCRRYGVVKKYFEKEGAELVDDLLISNVVLGADYIVNLPKFKTHGLTLLTAAVKNMFGAVPGLKKTYYHRIARSKEDFADILVRVAETVRPDLNIVDGVVAMAGNGPSAGETVNVGLIAAGVDMHAVDCVLAELAGVAPEHVDTIAAAARLGLIDLQELLNVLGEGVTAFKPACFKLPLTYTSRFRESKWFGFLIAKLMGSIKVRPKVAKKACKKCGMCLRICPISAIAMNGDYPSIDNKKCIECYCCHEVCPEGAVKLRESILLKIMKVVSARR